MVIVQNFKQLEAKKMWNLFSGTLKLKIPHKIFFEDNTKNILST